MENSIISEKRDFTNELQPEEKNYAQKVYKSFLLLQFEENDTHNDKIDNILLGG